MLTTYVALLRGIGPGNPNMRNEKLREVFEGLGFSNVQSVISSGNIIFSCPKIEVADLESKIEAALASKLGLNNAAIVRSRSQLQKIADDKSFAKLDHSPKTYLTVTFLKRKIPGGKISATTTSSEILKIDSDLSAIMAITDTTSTKTPDFMAWLEKQFGKDITTRTFKTIGRILKKMDTVESKSN